MQSKWLTYSDNELARIALCEPDAFGVLYDRYVIRIFRYCYRRFGDRSESEDVTSAIFIRAYERIGSFRGGSFPAWLFAIARSVSSDSFRQSNRTNLRGIEEERPSGEDLAHELIAADRTLAISVLMATLTDEQREIIDLRLAGLTGKEIADVTGKSLPAIKMLQLRAMKRLKGLVATSRLDDW